MSAFLFSRFSGPLVGFGVVVAFACLAGSWYINRLQADLARTIRQDAAAMDAADELQLQLRHLRVHTLVLVADNTDARREVVQADLEGIDAALRAIRDTSPTHADAELAAKIEVDYTRYRDNLGLDRLPLSSGLMSDLARWSDSHHMDELLSSVRKLADRQHQRMKSILAESEMQTSWAGRALLLLGAAGVLAGLISGYATAKTLQRRVAQLFVRVQAVQAQLDHDVGTMTLKRPSHFGGLDEQLDRVVARVSEVCQRLQEQERGLLRAEQLAAVGQLAAGVAHEIRNPLTGVKLLLQAAVRGQNPTPLSPDRLHLLLHEVERIERTVQGLMDAALLPTPNRQRQDLRFAVEAALHVAQTRAEMKSAAVRFESTPDPCIVTIDWDQFLSLLTNLLFNAIDAIGVGGEVGVSIHRRVGDRIEVMVSDNGPGIDDGVVDTLFNPFTTTKPTGAGLGLTVARRVAQEHGGTLTAANRPSGGACFSLTIPAAE